MRKIHVGDIEALENKWWAEESECWMKSTKKHVAKMSALYVNKPEGITLDMFMGPLLLILVGVILAIIVAIGEIIYYKQKGRVS